MGSYFSSNLDIMEFERGPIGVYEETIEYIFMRRIVDPADSV